MMSHLFSKKDFHYYEPTPEEIKAECKRIQDEWTPEEELRRRTGAYKQIPFKLHGSDKDVPLPPSGFILKAREAVRKVIKPKDPSKFTEG